jgi:hypothetical protein
MAIREREWTASPHSCLMGVIGRVGLCRRSTFRALALSRRSLSQDLGGTDETVG